MHDELLQINNMIGLHSFKEQFVKQISYYLSESKARDILMHTIICGDAGTGKTTISKLIGKAYNKSGILSSNAFVIATRKDLIGKYLGQTAHHTTEMFDKARGGVLFIDEIYSLNSSGSSDIDSYANEAIDYNKFSVV